MSDNFIDANEMLALIEQASSITEFSLEFVRSRDGRGGPKGSIKSIDRARKGYPKGKRQKSPSPKITAGSKRRPLHKVNATLPIVDMSEPDQILSVRLAHIISFNKYKVRH